jgi:hypothetical protein
MNRQNTLIAKVNIIQNDFDEKLGRYNKIIEFIAN